MARIRTIKPEFWEDEVVGGLGVLARLLFVGSWNLADDEGLLRWTPDYLAASLFMYDGDALDVASAMKEVERARLVFPYTGGKTNQRLAYVVNFRRHQRINRPSPAKLPPPSLQNYRVREMYADRDGWTCHLCRSAILPRGAGVDEHHSEALEIDHVIPRSKGGTDYPSNLRSAHAGCNAARRDVDIYSVSDSVSDSRSDSLREGKGGEGKGGGKEGDARGARPAPFCDQHPGGTTKPCRACGDARRQSELWTPPPTPTPPSIDEAASAPRCDHGAVAGACAICRRLGETATAIGGAA